ncbi:MAG TPA: winged helix DNA-binding domain-containing protein [Actinomycetota bacterium]|nr:winged helix DNA-binding domain-containing protein [Actinomycetota bacterium]
MDGDERRRRSAARHHLARPATSVEEATAGLVGLHSSDPVTVHLSLFARVTDFTTRDLEETLYERKTLVRMLGMRRTMFVVPLDVAAIMDEACTKAIAPRERRRLVKHLADQGFAKDAERWLDDVSERTLAALRARGEAAAVELTRDVPELGRKLIYDGDNAWARPVGVSTRVLFLLAAEGRIVRARPRGSWISGQYRWAELETWLGGPLPRLDHREACAELLRRWLHAFGPGTMTDITWWTGWTVKQTKASLDDVGAVGVDLGDGATGWIMPDDLEDADPPGRWVRLLPALDATVMGWKERDWFLGPHASDLFDRNGNAGPTIWADGRVVGGWTQMPDGRIATKLLEDVDARTQRLLRAESGRLEGWFGDARITPRFRSPVDRELRGT